ncbi:aryl-sulfate sulfotransferase, partial [Streptomyces sp. IF17]|nr:aryl-sulfate sulfotransferase [Streptomyces alkaliphilus]
VTCLRYLRRKCDQLEAARQAEGVMQAQMAPQKRTLQTTH